MTVSAHDVAAELRSRQPCIASTRLNRLLYFCQGHHAAATGSPLFAEAVIAAPDGPIIDGLDESQPSGQQLGNAELNTIGYVLSRYGKSATIDLTHISRGEAPWRESRAVGLDAIPLDFLISYFRGPGSETADEMQLDPETVRNWLRDVASRPAGPDVPDDIERLKARLVVGA